MSDIHSTGRGGAGNIGHEPNTTYADGGMVHEGTAGHSTRGEYSSGRGGAGNIYDSPSLKPQAGGAAGGNVPTLAPVYSEDIVPETATRQNAPEKFHTGRGGDGNAIGGKHHGHAEKDGKHESLVDKAKHLVGLDKHKKEGE